MSKETVVSLQRLNVVNNSTSSIIQVGDRQSTYQYKQGISIQRSKALYGFDEPYFTSYRMFCYAMPPLYLHLPAGKVVHEMYGKLAPLPSPMPTIEVGRVNIITSSSSSNIHIGNGCRRVAENRQKNIRQFLDGIKLDPSAMNPS